MPTSWSFTVSSRASVYCESCQYCMPQCQLVDYNILWFICLLRPWWRNIEDYYSTVFICWNSNQFSSPVSFVFSRLQTHQCSGNVQICSSDFTPTITPTQTLTQTQCLMQRGETFMTVSWRPFCLCVFLFVGWSLVIVVVHDYLN